MRIAIIGKGNVGTALAAALKRCGHEIKFGHRDPKEPVREAAKWGEIIILAVPYEAVPDAAKHVGPAADGKPLIDVTNALSETWDLALGFTTSAAEELQKILPNAHVVKAFNTVFSQNQSSGKISGERLTAFIAGDDPVSKQAVMQLAKDIGFDPVDSGPLKSSRYLEPMGKLIIDLGYTLKMGTKIGLRLVKS